MSYTNRHSHPLPNAGQKQGDSHPAALVFLALLLAATGSALQVLAGPPDLSRLPALPSWNTLEVLLRSRNVPIDGVLQVSIVAAWLVWFWATGSLVIELGLAVLENGPAHGAAWLRTVRSVASRLTLPLARRAVAAAIVVQVVARTAAPSAVAAHAPEPAAFIASASSSDMEGALVWQADLVEFRVAASSAQATSTARAPNVVTHTVQRGDTLWAIAERYYGSGEEFDRVIEANDGKVMWDGRLFDRAGLIFPGWVLDIPLPGRAIEEQDGLAYYVVHRGDTLRGIAAALLGDEGRYRELFDLNVGVARLDDQGPVLADPSLIWPELRLQLPADVLASTQPPQEPGEAGEPGGEVPASVEPTPLARAAVPDRGEPTAVPSATPDAIATPSPAWPPVASHPLTLEQAGEPTEPVGPTRAARPQPGVSMPVALAGGALAAAGVAGAAALVVRRRRSAPVPTEPETDAVFDEGFAEVDPSRSLVGGAPNPAAVVAGRLSRAYAAELAAALAPTEMAEIVAGISLVAIRHGRSSTTLTIAAPPAARSHLIQHLEAAVTTAFGDDVDDVDTEGLVSHDGDVVVRLTGVNRHITRGRLLELVGPDRSEAGLWPAPCLLPLGLLNDRQTLAANWDALGHILVAAPVGQGAEAILTALVASLVAERAPSSLGLVTIAVPRSLPAELGRLPHQLREVVDPGRGRDALVAIEEVAAELSRRINAGATSDPDLVLIIRELADLDTEQMAALGAVALDGPRYRVRLLAACERAPAELVQRCALLNEFGTRLILQAADEDESVALLGTPGAEELSAGGQVLLRLDGRTPVQANAYRVPPQHLTRLLKLMGDGPAQSWTQEAAVDRGLQPGAESASAAAPENSQRAEDVRPIRSDCDVEQDKEEVEVLAQTPGPEVCEFAASIEPADQPRLEPPEPVEGPSEPIETVVDKPEPQEPSPAANPKEQWRESRLLQQLRAAPLRVQCFGGRGVWHSDELIWPRPGVVEETGWELLLILAIHPMAGVQAEMLVDIVWPEKPPDNPSATLRKRRWRLRQELKQLLPTFDGDPLPTDPNGLVYSLDPNVIASDMHQFLELIAYAKSLPRDQAIVAYEEALGLYHGDLLDSPDVPTYWWLYNGHALATTLRSDYRRQQRDVRLLLADLCGGGASPQELARAQELYAGLTAEDPEDERLWSALFKVHGRRGDSLGLEVAARRLRMALVELGQGDDPDSVALPPGLERVLKETRAAIGQQSGSAVA